MQWFETELQVLCRGKLADPGNRLLGREDQQAVASQSSAAEHTAAASSTLDSVLPPSTAHNRASSSQQDHAPAKSSNAARPAAKEPAQAGQHSSQRQRAKELPCNAQNPSNVTKTNATINHSHLLRQAKSSDVAALQAASNTAGRFTGFA